MLAALRSCIRAQRPWTPSHFPSIPCRNLSINPQFTRASLPPSHASQVSTILSQARQFHASPIASVTLNQATRRSHKKRATRPKSPLLKGDTQRKGVVSSVFTMKPKKPNSAKRKVARVKLTTGKAVHAYIAGEGHNLQEHSVVLVRGGRTQDLPGVRYKIIRGVLDCGAVPNRRSARSRYGAKRPKQS